MRVADHGTGFDIHMFVARSACIQAYYYTYIYSEIELYR